MARWIAFLRAINVGGHNVKMAKLRQLFESLGFTEVETFLASGNVVFETAEPDRAALEKRIAGTLQDVLGYEVNTFIRTPAEVAQIAVYQPFSRPELETAVAFNVAFVDEPLDGESVEKLMALKTEIDDFHSHGPEVYWLCRKRQSESTFSTNVLEKALSRPATMRGMKTIKRLAARYPQAGP